MSFLSGFSGLKIFLIKESLYSSSVNHAISEMLFPYQNKGIYSYWSIWEQIFLTLNEQSTVHSR